MKQLITITIIAALTSVNVLAELTTKQFVQLRDWAASRGDLYEGTEDKFGVQCFVFSNKNKTIFGFVPVSSDTADEAINALIASSIHLSRTSETAKKHIEDVKATPAPALVDDEESSAVTPIPTAIEVRASDITKHMKPMQLRLTNSLKAKTLSVIGIVDDVAKDILGQPCVTLETEGFWTVECMFPKEDSAILPNTRKA